MILLPCSRCVNSVLIKTRDLCVVINICCRLTPTGCCVNRVDSPQQSEEPTSGWRGTSWRPPTPVLSPLRQPVVRQLATNHPTGRRQGQEGLSTFPRSASLDGTAATGRQRKTQPNSTPKTLGPITMMTRDFFFCTAQRKHFLQVWGKFQKEKKKRGVRLRRHQGLQLSEWNEQRKRTRFVQSNVDAMSHWEGDGFSNTWKQE